MSLLVRATTRILGPGPQRLQKLTLLRRHFAEQARGRIKRVLKHRVRRLVITELLIRLIKLGAKDADGGTGGTGSTLAGGFQRKRVLSKGAGKRLGRRKEPLLEQLEHKLAGDLLALVTGPR